VDFSRSFRREIARLLVNEYYANMELLNLSIVLSGLYKHMDGLTNDVEMSNEMVGFVTLVATKLLAYFTHKPFYCQLFLRFPFCKRS
jgi:hypothetical protein